MALGKKLLEWDYKEMAKGISSSDDIPDGGFQNLTEHINLIASPGVAYQPNISTDNSSGLNGEIIASCEDPTSSYQKLFVSTEAGLGRFYSANGLFALTQRGINDSSHAYIFGRTDMIAFDNEAYITSASTIVRWSSIGAANTFDTAFYSFTGNAFAPHPAIVYEGLAYFGDGKYLVRMDSAGATPSIILTFTGGIIITALGIDPGSGRMLIATIGQPNLSDTLQTDARVFFYNGYSDGTERVVNVEDMITAFQATQGALYAAYGQNLGLWNGSGITFLRHLEVQFVNTQLLYKYHFSAIGSTLYFVDRYRIMAYGAVRQKGDNVFYPAVKNFPSGVDTDIASIHNMGQNYIGFSYATSKFFTWNTYTVSGQAQPQSLFTNFTEFDDEYWVRRVRIIFKNKVGASTNVGYLRLYDDGGIVSSALSASSGLIPITNTNTGASVSYIDFLFNNVKLRQLALNTIMSGNATNYGIRRMVAYGELANRP